MNKEVKITQEQRIDPDSIKDTEEELNDKDTIIFDPKALTGTDQDNESNQDDSEETEDEDLDEEVIEDSEPSTETEDSLKSEKKEPKPVEGETPREKALRKQIVLLRKKNREAERQKMFNKESIKSNGNETNIDPDKYKSITDEYSEDEIKRFGSLFEVMAEKKGYIKKSHNYGNMVNDTLEDFLDNNPEYSEENDEEDVRYGLFDQRIRSGIYSLEDKNKKQLKEIFKEVHNYVNNQLGESETKEPRMNVNKRNAQIQKIKSVSHKGGGSKIEDNKKKSIPMSKRNLETQKMFHGNQSEWDELLS